MMERPVARNAQEREMFDYIDSLTMDGKARLYDLLLGIQAGIISVEELPNGMGIIREKGNPPILPMDTE